jgi:hypothetical protein
MLDDAARPIVTAISLCLFFFAAAADFYACFPIPRVRSASTHAECRNNQS